MVVVVVVASWCRTPEGAHVFITGRRKDALDAAIAENGANVTGPR